MIRGWEHPAGRFRSYYVPQELHIPGYSHPRRWCFTLIDGWRDYARAPLHAVAFAQWEQCTRALTMGRALVPHRQWIEVHLEHFLANPSEQFSRLCDGIGIRDTPALRNTLTELVAEPVNALSAPGLNKWRREHAREIGGLLPKIAPLALEAGYVIDVATGEAEIRTAMTEQSRADSSDALF